VVGWLFVALLSAFSLAADRSEFLLLDEVRIGMVGVGKTVVAGDLIETFDVQVLGVIDQPGTLSDFIVVRVSGEVIGRAGGIAQGMSGSPIYIDGKLIGALSRAAHWSDHTDRADARRVGRHPLKRGLRWAGAASDIGTRARGRDECSTHG